MGNKKLEQLIFKYSSYDQKIYDNTSIVRDLEIKDKQAKAFIDEFAEEFNMDLSDFNFLKYFPSENDEPSTANRCSELNIADLERALLAGELNDNIIGFDENDPHLPPQYTVKKIILGLLLTIIIATLLGIVAIYL